MATVVMIKTGDLLVGVPVGTLPEMAGQMHLAMMPTPMAPTPPPVESAAPALLPAPPLVPFVARLMAVGGVALVQILALPPFPSLPHLAPLMRCLKRTGTAS